ncbi:alpha-amylase family glycosyl hydrolase [Arcicella sp. LKC2W]|uniref:alpha-amylase family glycosyl hydrolase n=1 Tax=Arcicella sp. LKC2W TaxID=2984198 RepID=UPI002B20CB8A|nr:alpha-amylase family glycosyl hydrolase [Arcicella sp. LKC2W]MEA5458209.1 alpha-amylase family glycosyl hydrolase [Arcicella sp. LKC2W]
MKKIIFLFATLWTSWLPIFGQVVTTDPVFPTADQEITLIFDLTLAKDARAKGLLGKKDDVYLWSGAGSTTTGDAFQFQPTGQSNFAIPYEKGKMTALGNDKWSIKLKPRDYYGVPANVPIKRLGVLLKSGDGKSQTEDLFVTLYDNKLSIAVITPNEKTFYVEAGSSISVLAVASQKADIELTVNNISVSKITNKDSLRYNFTVSSVAGATQNVKITATTTTETATNDFTVNVKPTPTIAALPTGVQDGINYISDTKVTLVLFAPKKDFVYAIGDFSDWLPDAKFLMKRTPDGNRYWVDIDGLMKAQEYAFQYLINGTLAVGDPYCEKILDPDNDSKISSTTYPNLKVLPATVKSIASVFQTGQTLYSWKITNFKRPAQRNLVVYELHIRDFDKDGSYKNAIDRISYFKNLGVNCIELMPISEFSNNDSWGYNPTYFLAPDKAYGTKDDLKKFIDVCHENGIAVVLDVVYNQADYEFPYVKMYWDGAKPSTDSPFFNQQATHPFSVFFDFNHESQATKDYVNRANEFWLKEYKIDGYRFDLAKGFTQRQSTNDNFFRLYDQGRVNIWKEYYDKIRSYDKDAYVILELFSEDQEEQTLTDMGMMVWANQNDDAKNAVKGYASDFSRYSYKARGFKSPAAVGYMESHDEERMVYDGLKNGREAFSLPTVLERVKASAATFLTIPGPKMIWQFGELGYDVSIDQNGRTGRKPIRWEYFQDADRLKLYKVFAELIKIKTNLEVAKTTDFQLDVAGMVKKVSLNGSNNNFISIANLDVKDNLVANIFPKTGKWYDFFTGTITEITDVNTRFNLKAGEFHIYTSTPLPKPEANLVPWKALDATILATENEMAEGMKLYPNPSNDFIYIEIPELSKGTFALKINDLAGKALLENEVKGGQKTYSLDVQKLPKGTYFINAEQGEKRFVKKFVKL